jgi:hypothetical protein
MSRNTFVADLLEEMNPPPLSANSFDLDDPKGGLRAGILP